MPGGVVYTYVMDKVHVHLTCWNEEAILPSALDHYRQAGVDKIYVYDHGSSDGSPDIATAHDKCELIEMPYHPDEPIHIVLTHFKNHAWKASRGKAEWVIVCDADEFVYHPCLVDFLNSQKKKGVTICVTHGWNMLSETFPLLERPIYREVTKGVRWGLWLDRNAAFNPQAIQEMNYTVGCHSANPVGTLKYKKDPLFCLLHYKWLGAEYVVRKNIASAKRMPLDIQRGWGVHYLTPHMTDVELMRAEILSTLAGSQTVASLRCVKML